MFELTEADVFRLVEMFASSDATFMQVRVDDVELVLSRNSQDGVRTDPDTGVSNSGTLSSAGSGAGTAPVAAAAAPAPSAPPTPTPTPAPAPAAPSAVEDASLVTVDASSIGTFYRAPRPDLPPYVEVGAAVEPDTTVCLIEAMKVFTGVTAGVRGTVAEVLVEDGQFVEYGQPLFRVRPVEPESAAA
jgi:acetyl-CoA carboxylase biotin carboxyl carrier protein